MSVPKPTAQANATANGVSFLGLLTLLFIAFKLAGLLAWSWWWVLAPLWAPWALLGAFIAGYLAVWGLEKLVRLAVRRVRAKRQRRRALKALHREESAA